MLVRALYTAIILTLVSGIGQAGLPKLNPKDNELLRQRVVGGSDEAQNEEVKRKK